MSRAPIFAFSSLFAQIAPALPVDEAIYLVGGVVRDFFLDREKKDFDFAMQAGALETGRRVADLLGAAYYPLDETRQTARVILAQDDGQRIFLDFALFRGPDLESDLRNRDFTINSLAIDVRNPQTLLDPLGGLADLRDKVLRACSDTAFIDDPVRIFRGVRLAVSLNFRIPPETYQQMRQAVPRLPMVSPERLRDELFRILESPKPAAALRLLDILTALPHILPELQRLKEVSQPPPHIYDAWEHTLETVRSLEQVLGVLSREFDSEKAANLSMGLISLQLGRYRAQLADHLRDQITTDRRLLPLLYLAALYHDVGKPAQRQQGADGRIRFIGHEAEGRRLISRRAQALHLSANEIERLGRIVAHHMRPLQLSAEDREPSRRAVYRFYRDLGPAGVDVCLLSLADGLATYGPTLVQDYWRRHLHLIRLLMEAWWERPAESVSPPELLRGGDLIRELQLEPGPVIGRLLEAIREAQAAGELDTRAEALALARKWLSQGGVGEQADF